MAAQRKSARQRLVQAALQLFAAQGVTETTTRQIAELAEVNEVTLFRQFGSKQGLLLAVIEEAEVFTQIGKTLEKQANQISGLSAGLQAYAESYLEALARIPEFIRSIVGEAGHYPQENREAIGRGLTQVHNYTTQYIVALLSQERERSQLSPRTLASLINTLLLGYSVIEFTTEFHEFWQNRQEFITSVVSLFLLREGRDVLFLEASPAVTTPARAVQDLPATLVREILQSARQSSLGDYALAYSLFGAGLGVQEAINLQRTQLIYDNQQCFLEISQGAMRRQVPLNQWIMGYRYGSPAKNPLTQWLKSRKDQQSAMFITEAGLPMGDREVGQRWQEIVGDLIAPLGGSPRLEQAQETWRVEMLVRGLSLEALSLLCGCDREQLQPYARRAQEKAALEQAIRLDRPPGKSEPAN
ncbi:MAG: TetR family transcriptional regulator [Chloroflexaceae bacterium]|nr:TetR family transcriptional regulator [Chloroflexaceae bacterium]